MFDGLWEIGHRILSADIDPFWLVMFVWWFVMSWIWRFAVAKKVGR